MGGGVISYEEESEGDTENTEFGREVEEDSMTAVITGSGA